MNDHPRLSAADPVIILLGGPMMVDDGSTLDSRQPISGDPTSHVTHTSLATSHLWWLTAASLVGRLLDSAGTAAFALLIGNRSVVELRRDGTLRRRGLRALIPGSTSELELIRTGMDTPLPDGYTEAHKIESWNGDIMGTVGFKTSSPASRWRFLKGNEFYLSMAGRQVGASVLVDTSETLTDGGGLFSARFEAFEQRRLYEPDSILVMPHTHRTESLVRGYLAWVQAGRPAEELPANTVPEWDPLTPPDPVRYSCPVPAEANFGITGLVQNGEWCDPSELEAARSLLQARYDLKIGIWDLVDNPTLRRALLTPTPQASTPKDVALIPSGAAKRAEERVAAKVAEKADAERSLSRISQVLAPMRALGWSQRKTDLDSMHLPLTDRYPSWPGSDSYSLVNLTLQIGKRQTTVHLSAPGYDQANLAQYLASHRMAFEDIASPESVLLHGESSPILWRTQGGWADAIDWERRANAFQSCTVRWRKELDELCCLCIEAHRRKFGNSAPTQFGGNA